MSTEDDRAAIERFVAGAPVEADALAAAITAKAVDRTVVVEALLKGLGDPDPVIRLRTAFRIARMPEVDLRVTATLTLTAASDADAGCRDAASAALRRHELPVPGERAEDAGTSARARPRLLLRAWAVRSAAGGVDLAARYREHAPNLDAQLLEAPGGHARVELRGLPPAFAGTRPLLRARVVPAPEPLTPVGRAAHPVSADGEVTIEIPLEGASLDELADWLTAGADLTVPDE